MNAACARTRCAFWLGVAAILLAGCVTTVRPPGDASFDDDSAAQARVGARAADPGAMPYEMPPPRPGIRGGVGEDIARHLQARYDDTSPYCTKPSDPNPQPAVLCSGILLRVSTRGPGFHIWNPNPGSPIKNGVPFSWLRRDAAFATPVWGKGSGYILMPRFATDESGGFRPLTVLCVFPFDGWTWERTGGNNDGCDQFGSDTHSRPCQAQNITTSHQWVTKFGWDPPNERQCGFALGPGTANAYLAFRAHMEIRQGAPNGFTKHNELMVGTWPQNDPALPLEAFFYVNGSGGRGEAMLNQEDFFSAVGRWVPVIQVTMPVVPNGMAAFRYLKEDQPIQ
ncbi:hypothetical protein [Luteibacter yeojuensis]|uniref:Halovibrin HvnA n=1 Tax=Luteibacter yeojuensis TaxID=345309 RepID=A0A7X5TQ65_9GAMM|nr:hypothetical protein [Luteibacter yeojuensis]NID15197.1 hypothetical protein [Luteibacter yeojuensis]